MKSKKNIDHDHSNKYIITLEFNKPTAENVAARLDFDEKLKKFNKTITSKEINMYLLKMN